MNTAAITPDQARRIHDAIAECNRFIEKEESRRADIRPADVQKYLDFCKSHKAVLIEMLGRSLA